MVRSMVWGMLMLLCTAVDAATFKQEDPTSKFLRLTVRLSKPDIDICTTPAPDQTRPNVDFMRFDLLTAAEAAVLAAANANPDDPAAFDRELALLKQKSDKAAHGMRGYWGFYYDINRMGDAVIVDLSAAQDADFVLFAKQPGAGPDQPWRMFEAIDPKPPGMSGFGRGLGITPLQHSPPGVARFVVSSNWGPGCAGGTQGISDQVFQWNPERDGDDGQKGSLKEVATLMGELNLDGDNEKLGSDHRDENTALLFNSDGLLETGDGRLIMQSCRWSAIDTWDHLALCGVDLYDLTGDSVRYIERREIYPDLGALATAIDHARKHDERALAGYVATPELAHELISAELPDFSDQVQVENRPDGGEDVTLGWELPNEPLGTFTLIKRDGNWIVTDYQPVKDEDK